VYNGGLLSKVKGMTVSRETHPIEGKLGATRTEDFYEITDMNLCELYANKFVELLPEMEQVC